MNEELNYKKIVSELHLDSSEYEYNDGYEDILSRMKTYKFSVNGISYTIYFYIDKLGFLDVYFENDTESQKVGKKKFSGEIERLKAIRNAKYGKTNTGNSIQVFNIVYNAVVKYIKKYKPKYIKYAAEEENRAKLYYALLHRAEKETNLKFVQIDDYDEELKLEDDEYLYRIEYK